MFMRYGCLGCLFVTTSLFAQPQLDVMVGRPTTSQNIDISHADLRFYKPISSLFSDKCDWGVTARAGVLNAGNDSSGRYGAEGLFACDIGENWSWSMPLGMVWLSRYQFEGDNGKTKDYGGPWQFVAAMSLSYRFTEHWSVGYEWSHMSNWYKYEKNPALNSHNLMLSYRF